MDTQGYEGFIMEGAKAAIAARVPMVIEFWPYGMSRADSYHPLRKAMLGYEYFFDLSDEQPKPRMINEVDALYKKLGEGGASTDILLL